MRRRISGIAVAALVAASLGAGSRDTRVADAAERRDAAGVTALLTQRVDVNAPQPDGGTALHWAAHWNDAGLVTRLLAAGANPNLANDYGVTPLFLAATNGSADVIGALLDKGANANAGLPTGQTILMTAVRSGSVPAVTRLIAAGADVNATQASKGQTALMWAATSKRVDVAQALLAGGAKVNARSASGFTPLLFAAREGAVEMSRALLAAGADINEAAVDGSTPIFVAVVRGHTTLAEFLLEKGAKADGNPKTGFTPLHYAVFRTEHPFARKDTDLSGEAEWAAMAGIPDRDAKLKLIDALIAHGADVNAVAEKSPGRGYGGRGGTPFEIAGASGDAPLMRLLLQKGAKPVVMNTDGTSLVMTIIAAGNAFSADRVSEADRLAAIRVALEYGADIEAKDANGYRAMHLAAAAEFHKIILFLLDRGADLNPVTKTRVQKEGTNGSVTIAGQSPLGIVEGTFNGGTYNERPETAAFLRTLGAKSVGRATLQTYILQEKK